MSVELAVLGTYGGGSGVPVSCEQRSSNPSWISTERAAGCTSRGRWWKK